MSTNPTHPARALLWGGQTHDNIIMRMRETGLPIIAQDGSTVYITNLITGEQGGNLIPIFIETPVRVVIYKHQYAPNFYASSFKVDMASKKAADRLVDRLFGEGYVKEEVFPPYNTPPRTNNVAYSPLSMVTARMEFKQYFDTMCDTQCRMGVKNKADMIKEAMKYTRSPEMYLNMLKESCIASNLTASIAEADQVKQWFCGDMDEDDEYCWATILLWEIRMRVQMEMASGDVVTHWLAPAELSLQSELPQELVDEMSIYTPAKGWVVCDRIDSISSLVL